MGLTLQVLLLVRVRLLLLLLGTCVHEGVCVHRV